MQPHASALPPFKFVTQPHEWHVCLQEIQNTSRLAIDLEANSMFAYRERICLIQISTPDSDYIIDPLSKLDFQPLGNLIADPAIEKIFHAAEYDLILLKREFGWECQNLFDTMWAARILGYQRFGLASLLEDIYDVTLNKRYQKSNWCQRPLTPPQLAYAQLDTHYLSDLRDHLMHELEVANCVDEAAEIFAEQSQVSFNNNAFKPDDFWSIKGVRRLNGRQQAVLKALTIFRDGEAKSRNQPLFKILHNQTLLQLAQKEPVRLNQLRDIFGMTNGQMRRYGRSLLQVIHQGKKASHPKPPKKGKRPPEDVMSRYDKLRTWRKLRAQARGVESDVVMNRQSLWEIARVNPQSQIELSNLETVGPWRQKTYGQELLNILQ